MIIRRYNPIYMKPTALEPYVPYNLPIYWGPDPAAGISYGAYTNKAKTIIVTKKQDNVYCPVSGEKMEFLSDVEVVDFENTKAGMISDNQSCSSCGEKSYSNFGVEEEMHCWNCGDLLQGEGKTMSKVKKVRESWEAKLAIAESEQEFVNLKEILEELDSEKIEEVSEEEMEAIDEANEEAEEVGTEEAPVMEEEESTTNDESEKVEEESVEEESEEAPVMEEEAEASEESEEAEASEEACDEETAEEIAKEVSKEVGEEIQEKLQEQIDDLKEEEAEEEAEELEEMVDLDIVLSSIKKESKTEAETEEVVDLEEIINEVKEEVTSSKEEMVDLSEVITASNKIKEENMKTKKQAIARVRAKAKARFLKKRVAAELAKKEETKPVVAEAPVVEPAEVVVPNNKEVKEAHNVVEVKNKDIKEVEEAAPSAEELAAPRTIEGEKVMEKMDDPSEALRYESLASLDSLNNQDLDLVLFGEGTENPTWIAFANQMPIAKIECANQENSEAIREVFASNDYASDLVKHCSDIGVVEVLKKVHAQFFANHISDKAIASRYETEAQEKIAQYKTQAQAQMRNELVNALDVITVAMNKNLYPDVGHPLKESLFESMVLAGMPENTAASVIDSSFATAASKYYSVVFDKALAFMNMSEASKSEIKNMVSDSNVVAAEINNNPATLENRLANASSIASLQSSGSKLEVTSSVKIDKDSYKSRLKNVISR